MPEFGGRLWSLFDKKEDRNIIYENPVIQPANLAIRNAWLSGGVEWNIGLRGHSPLTCSDVFCARVTDAADVPLLRVYEFERIRQVPYAIDFILPPSSSVLFVYVRIINPNDGPVPMYWWSNIAFPEDPGTRVVAPATAAFRFGYGKKGLYLVEIPIADGVDVSYSTNLNHSADFFFDIPENQRKWIAGIDRNGAGLFQASTDMLRGRKLFVWGRGSGGKAWQNFLSTPGKPYIEIQSGLAHTQMEHIPMPAKTQWDWLEAYGCVKVDSATVHGQSWSDAYTSVGEKIESIIPSVQMEEYYRSAKSAAKMGIAEVLHRGSGWGQLEGEYRERNGLDPLCGDELQFDCKIEASQRQWVDLLTSTQFPQPDPQGVPVGYEVEPKWQKMLKNYLTTNENNWYAWLHLGLMLFSRTDYREAERAWTRSVESAPNPWAYRNLALLAKLQDDTGTSISLYEEAYHLNKTSTPLLIEYGTALLDAGLVSKWLEVYCDLEGEIRKKGRLQLLYARGLFDSGDLDAALELITHMPEITDLKEGENSLTDIWYQVHERIVAQTEKIAGEKLKSYVREKFPPPSQIDFRMRT